MKDITEFRKDIVSGDWVLISSQIQKKPIFFKVNNVKPLPKSLCPFEDKRLSEQEDPLLWLPRPGKNDSKDWWVQIFSNKYPVVVGSKICPPLKSYGAYQYKAGVGFQELVLTRDHKRPMGQMTQKEIELVIEAYKTRFQALRNEPCVEYILIFHNSGPKAGATVPHPHSQILALPIIPPDVARSLIGSGDYFRKHKKCVHCDIITGELKKRVRVIFENKFFVAIAPYASRTTFEVRIFPKIHESHFEALDALHSSDLAMALLFIFRQIRNKMKNPDYNFFIHTAPPKGKNFHHYHWHIEVLPRLAIFGGVELGVGIDILKVSPEAAAQILKK